MLSFLQLIISIILSVLTVYLIGLSLVSIIDNRLSKVSLKLPNQKVIVELDDKKNIKNTKYIDTSSNINYIENFENKVKLSDDDYLVEGYTNKKIDKDFIPIIDNGNSKNMVSYDDNDTINIDENSYGYTNYAHPNNMSEIDKNIFMFQYPPNMTLQDYINWLWCYKNMEDKLTYTHLRNLNILKNGGKIYYEEGITPPPALENPPLNSEKYFQKLYKNNKINLAAPLNSTTGPMLAYNYGEYSDFHNNMNVNGLSGKLNTDPKDDVKRLEKLMRPNFVNKPRNANITM